MGKGKERKKREGSGKQKRRCRQGIRKGEEEEDLEGEEERKERGVKGRVL